MSFRSQRDEQPLTIGLRAAADQTPGDAEQRLEGRRASFLRSENTSAEQMRRLAPVGARGVLSEAQDSEQPRQAGEVLRIRVRSMQRRPGAARMALKYGKGGPRLVGQASRDLGPAFAKIEGTQRRFQVVHRGRRRGADSQDCCAPSAVEA
jgi:hypothetical protein